MEIWFVGMRFRGNHRFTENDEIKLEPEDNNSYDPNAVKVLVLKENEWKHVAYCDRDSALRVRNINKWDNLKFNFIDRYPQSVKYSIIYENTD